MGFGAPIGLAAPPSTSKTSVKTCLSVRWNTAIHSVARQRRNLLVGFRRLAGSTPRSCGGRRISASATRFSSTLPIGCKPRLLKTPIMRAAQAAISRWLDEALAALDVDACDLLRRHYWGGESLAAIAQDLELSRNTVTQRHGRLLRRLHARLPS